MDENNLSPQENDDPVVKEIPIIVSKRLEKQLFVFQYPLAPKSRQRNYNVRKCFIKPKNQEVKVEVEINTESQSFDGQRAEELAHRIDGLPQTREEDKEVVFENDLLDKVIYKSVRPLKNVSKYAVGAYNGKEYHITPLQGFLQMRPSYDHLDNFAKKKPVENEKELSEEEDLGTNQAQQVTVRFSRGDSERFKKFHETSYQSLMKKRLEEPWMECNWEKSNSSISEIEKSKLYAENTSEMGQLKQMDNDQYLRQLVPEDREKAVIKPCLPANILSLQDLRALPILEQCKLLFKDAKIIQFQQLYLLLAGCEGLTTESLLKTLFMVAVLVRGNWIIKSELLYPPETFSGITGVPSDQMCRARDYILYLFTKNQYLDRRKITSVVKLPNEEVKEIFTGISRLRLNKGWELLQPLDYDFINKHPETVQRQELMWEQRVKQLTEFTKDPKEKKARRKSKSVSEDKGVKRDAPSTSKEGGDESGEDKKKGTPTRGKKRARNDNSESSSKDD